MASKVYDIAVIGAGSGGLSIGLSMHELGFKVLLIDKSPASIGGECLNTGCVPSKALIHVSRIIHNARKAGQFGLKTQGQVDLDKVADYVHARQEKIRGHENIELFRSQGIDVEVGVAHFVSKSEIQVGDEVFKAKKIAIATGSKPVRLKVPGIDQVKYFDNESIFNLRDLPARLLVVGAGPISLELGQAFHRLGSEVVVIEVLDRIMMNEDPAMSNILMEQLQKEGMVFYLRSRLVEFKDPNTAVIEGPDGVTELALDAVLAGVGREVYFEGLKLENAGVKVVNGGIVSDRFMRTSNKNVVVIGDVVDSLKFSHGAEWQATIILNNFFSPFKKKLNYDKFSWVTFTDPEVATFGLAEKEIQKRGISYRRLELDFDEDDRAIMDNYQFGKLILFVGKSWIPMGNLRILGGTMIAPNAGEIFQEIVLARSAGLGIRSLFNKVYPYPTASRVNKTIVLNHYLRHFPTWLKRLVRLLY